MIDDLGYCHDCHSHVYEHPNVRCPNCGQGKPSPEVMGETDHVGRLIDIRIEIGQLSRKQRGMKHDRRALARHVLNDPELVIEARRRGIQVRSLDRWAAPPTLKSCDRGHPTAEWADWDGRAWRCRKCVEDGPRKAPFTGNVEARRDVNRMGAAWRKYEATLKERERLASLDQLPARLKPPMPPPTREP